MDIPVTHYLLAFCRLALGIVFALAFVGKVRNVRQFAQTSCGSLGGKLWLAQSSGRCGC